MTPTISQRLKSNTYTIKRENNSDGSTKPKRSVSQKKWDYFSRFTTLHGFRDIHDSNKILVKLFWIASLSAALGLGSYQTYRVVESHVNSGTTTLLNVVENSVPFYPPLRICYPHWLQWVDWDKVVNLGYTKEQTLTALSRLTVIFSETNFDVERANEEISLRASGAKFENFFVNIAYDQPPGFTLISYGANVTFRKYFYAPRLSINLMCYELDFEKINVLLNLRPDLALRESGKKLDFYFDSNRDISGSRNVTESEHQMYTAVSAKLLGTSGREEIRLSWQNAKKINFSYPALFYVDGSIDQMVTPNFYDASVYFVRLKGKVLLWPRGENETEDDATSSFAAVCRKSIYFGQFGDVVIAPARHGGIWSVLNVSTGCIRRHCRHSCEEWVFEARVTSGPKSFDLRLLGVETFVEVEYPSDVQILLYEEVRIHSWRTFVSSFAGITGLWLGASVLSFFQAFYFCLCKDVK